MTELEKWAVNRIDHLLEYSFLLLSGAYHSYFHQVYDVFRDTGARSPSQQRDFSAYRANSSTAAPDFTQIRQDRFFSIRGYYHTDVDYAGAFSDSLVG
jgi:hypothetical protein